MDERTDPPRYDPDPVPVLERVGPAAHFEPPREQSPAAIVAAWHPRGLRVAWARWAGAAGVVALAWLIASVMGGQSWPLWFLWVIVPWGAVLLVHTISAAGGNQREVTEAPAGTCCHLPLDDPPSGPIPDGPDQRSTWQRFPLGGQDGGDPQDLHAPAVVSSDQEPGA